MRLIIFLLLIISKNLYSEIQYKNCDRVLQEDNKLSRAEYTIYKDAKYSALFVHGLNNNASIMNDIISIFKAKNNFNIYNTALLGHRNDLEEFKKVKFKSWLEDVYTGYCHLEKLKKPIIFVGYSLGALNGLNLLISNSKVHFEKMILLAPAIKVNFYVEFIKLARIFGDDFIIKGLNNPEYYAHPGTTVAAYTALFEAKDYFYKHIKTKRLQVPTLLFIDPNDELISFSGLGDFVTEYDLAAYWKLNTVESKDSFHHRIFHKNAYKDKWVNFVQKLSKFI